MSTGSTVSVEKERVMRFFKILILPLVPSEWEAMKVRRVWIDRNKTAQFYGQLGQLVVQVGTLRSGPVGPLDFLHLVP